MSPKNKSVIEMSMKQESYSGSESEENSMIEDTNSKDENSNYALIHNMCD